MLPLAGDWTFGSFSDHVGGLDLFAGEEPSMPAFRNYRRWAYESAALDLALRQAGTTLAAALGREPEPITFVVSLRLGEPPSTDPVTRRVAAYPGTRFKLDSSPTWDDAFVAALAETGAVASVDFKGAYKGTTGRHPDRPGALPPLRRGVARRLAGGPGPHRAGGRRGARAVPRPDHLGRADPRRGRHRGAAVRAAHDQRQAVADRAGRGGPAHLRVVRRARHRHVRRRAVRARASGAGRSSTSRRSSTRTSRTTSRPPATTGSSSPRPACAASPLAPELDETGFRRRS